MNIHGSKTTDECPSKHHWVYYIGEMKGSMKRVISPSQLGQEQNFTLLVIFGLFHGIFTVRKQHFNNPQRMCLYLILLYERESKYMIVEEDDLNDDLSLLSLFSPPNASH